MEGSSVPELEALLLDVEASIERRISALFSLRNIPTPNSVSALIKGMRDPSALLAHEAAFALGQMGDSSAVPSLTLVLEDVSLHPIVRHEAAEALGNLGGSDIILLLRRYLDDPAPEVSETCQLALHRLTGEGGSNNLTGEGESNSSSITSTDSPAEVARSGPSTAPASAIEGGSNSSSITSTDSPNTDSPKTDSPKTDSPKTASPNTDSPAEGARSGPSTAPASAEGLTDELGNRRAHPEGSGAASRDAGGGAEAEELKEVQHQNCDKINDDEIEHQKIPHKQGDSSDTSCSSSRARDQDNPHQEDQDVPAQRFVGVDPAPSLAHQADLPSTSLREILLDEGTPLPERYGALFILRDRAADGSCQLAVSAIIEALQKCRSALLQHELAYVLGQLQDAASVSALSAALADASVHPMVRHEAAVALGSVADRTSTELLMRLVGDPEPIVAESCKVALDMMDFSLPDPLPLGKAAS